MKIYMARQPIYQKNRKLFGYELLYRNSNKNFFPGVDGNRASRELIYNALTEFRSSADQGEDIKYFINFTKDLLLSDIPFLMDPRHVIIEILENVTLTEELVQRIAELRRKKYTLALDDFVDDGQYDRIFPYISMIKVEYGILPPEKRREIAQKYHGKKLIAERIETKEDLLSAVEDGYQLMQGYYFSKPILESRDSIDISSTSYARLLKIMASDAPDYGLLAEIIEKDAVLTYKLLSLVNTMTYYRGRRVSNVKQALVNVGIVELRRWIVILMLREINTPDNDELTKQSLACAVSLKNLMPAVGMDSLSDDAYMVGILSGIYDALGSRFTDLIGDLGLSAGVQRAFLKRDNLLAEALDALQSYERGDWSLVDFFCFRYRISPETLASTYTCAIQYADRFFNSEDDSK
jgi:c-di-GMP-related signal transduction protein